jgi:hypothetical protein
METKKVEISVAEVAEICGCTEQSVRMWIEKGKVIARKVSGIWLVEKKSIKPLINPTSIRNPRKGFNK